MGSGQEEKSALFGLILMEVARPFLLLRHFLFCCSKKKEEKNQKDNKTGKKINLYKPNLNSILSCSCLL